MSRWLIVHVCVVAVVAASGCALNETRAAPLAGPSELALSLSLVATPDVLVQDGLSRSRVSATARDAASRPVHGLTLTVHVEGDDTARDSGRLVPDTVTTDEAGRASVTYTAPRMAPRADASAHTVAIVFTPVGTDAAVAVPRSVLIRLRPPRAIP